MAIITEGPIRKILKGRRILKHSSEVPRSAEEEKFWRDIDAQIEDEMKAYGEYSRLAKEAEQLGITGWGWLDDIALDEKRHKEILEALKRRKAISFRAPERPLRSW